MNEYPGIIGIKLGNTQLMKEDGTVIPCTVVQGGCYVVGKRTEEKDGYNALVLGIGERKPKHAAKAQRVAAEKAGAKLARHVREVRGTAEFVAGFELGQELKVEEIFSEGQRVDVQGQSKGSGFTGVMKRHNFAGAKASHGAHEWQRHGGSIGTTTTPGRVLPGKKMAGQHGNRVVSVLNQKIAKLVPEKQLVLIAGNVPGSKQSVVRVQGAVKKMGGKPKE
jgi:large subunit ribosomal protein L3